MPIVSMLARARKRSRQAQKIVAKWKAKLMELDREGVAIEQPRLWQEEHSFTTETYLANLATWSIVDLCEP